MFTFITTNIKSVKIRSEFEFISDFSQNIEIRRQEVEVSMQQDTNILREVMWHNNKDKKY